MNLFLDGETLDIAIVEAGNEIWRKVTLTGELSYDEGVDRPDRGLARVVAS